MTRAPVRLLRWGCVLYAPARDRVGLYLSELRIPGSGGEQTLADFAGAGPVQVFHRDGIAIGEIDFLEYALQPEEDLMCFLGRQCGVVDCREWKKLKELLEIRYGADLGEYEPKRSQPDPGQWNLLSRYGIPKKTGGIR